MKDVFTAQPCYRGLAKLSIGAVLGTGLLLSNCVTSAIAEPTIERDLTTVLAGIPVANVPSPVDTVSVDPVVADPVVVETRLVLSISERRVSLFQDDTLVTSYPVAVGAPETPTPQGEFTVSQMVIEPLWQSPWTGELHEYGPDSALGLRWIGFSESAAGSFGFHGTPTVNSIGQAVSNGCVRMYNEDVVALFDQVKVGTPVLVTP